MNCRPQSLRHRRHYSPTDRRQQGSSRNLFSRLRRATARQAFAGEHSDPPQLVSLPAAPPGFVSLPAATWIRRADLRVESHDARDTPRWAAASALGHPPPDGDSRQRNLNWRRCLPQRSTARRRALCAGRPGHHQLRGDDQRSQSVEGNRSNILTADRRGYRAMMGRGVSARSLSRELSSSSIEGRCRHPLSCR